MSIAEPHTYVDVEGAVREWARDLVSLVDRRVFFEPKNSVAYPQIVVFRIFGPDDAALIQFDCWGGTKEQALAVATQLMTEIDKLSRYIKLNVDKPSVLIHGATFTEIRWLPDEESNRARYTVEGVFTITEWPTP